LPAHGLAPRTGCGLYEKLTDDKTKVVVMGYVTAANAFNAKIRQPFSAIVVRIPDVPANVNNSTAWDAKVVTVGD
jgi:hypothetical protein